MQKYTAKNMTNRTLQMHLPGGRYVRVAPGCSCSMSLSDCRLPAVKKMMRKNALAIPNLPPTSKPPEDKTKKSPGKSKDKKTAKKAKDERPSGKAEDDKASRKGDDEKSSKKALDEKPSSKGDEEKPSKEAVGEKASNKTAMAAQDSKTDASVPKADQKSKASAQTPSGSKPEKAAADAGVEPAADADEAMAAGGAKGQPEDVAPDRKATRVGKKPDVDKAEPKKSP